MGSEYCVETTWENRQEIVKKIGHLGSVTNWWSDGSFNFRTDSYEQTDELNELLESLGLEFQLV